MTDRGEVPDEPSPSDLELDVKRASIRRNVSSKMASQLFTWGLATLLSIVVPRYLGPEIQGQVWLAVAIWMIGEIVISLGLSEYLQLEIAKRPRAGLDLVGPALVVRTIAFVVVSLPIAMYIVFGTRDRTFDVIMIITGLTALANTWREVMNAAFQGLERMSITASMSALSKFLNAAAVLVIIWQDGSVYGIIAVATATAALTFGVYAVILQRIHRVRFRNWTSVAPGLVRAGLPFMASSAALIVYWQIDAIVISAVAGDEALGWYGAADTLFGSLLFPATVIMATTFPSIGRRHEHMPTEAQRLITRTYLMLLVIAIPIGLGTILVAPSFVPLLYGEDFRETGTVLAVLGPVIVVTFCNILFGTVARATGRPMLWVRVLTVAAVLTVPLDLALVPWAEAEFDNGAIGGALAYVVTEGMQFMIGLTVVAPFLMRRRTTSHALRMLAAGGVMFAVGWPVRDRFLLVPIVVCGAVYAVALVCLRALPRDQRLLVGDVLRRVGISTRMGW